MSYVPEILWRIVVWRSRPESRFDRRTLAGRGDIATERVFEAFQRLHSREEHPETGIEIALCQQIVERHRRDIRVETGRDEGSTFTFTVPSEDEPSD